MFHCIQIWSSMVSVRLLKWFCRFCNNNFSSFSISNGPFPCYICWACNVGYSVTEQERGTEHNKTTPSQHPTISTNAEIILGLYRWCSKNIVNYGHLKPTTEAHTPQPHPNSTDTLLFMPMRSTISSALPTRNWGKTLYIFSFWSSESLESLISTAAVGEAIAFPWKLYFYDIWIYRFWLLSPTPTLWLIIRGAVSR